MKINALAISVNFVLVSIVNSKDPMSFEKYSSRIFKNASASQLGLIWIVLGKATKNAITWGRGESDAQSCNSLDPDLVSVKIINSGNAICTPKCLG